MEEIIRIEKVKLKMLKTEHNQLLEILEQGNVNPHTESADIQAYQDRVAMTVMDDDIVDIERWVMEEIENEMEDLEDTEAEEDDGKYHEGIDKADLEELAERMKWLGFGGRRE